MSVRSHIVVSLKGTQRLLCKSGVKLVGWNTGQAGGHSQCKRRTLIPLWCAPWQLRGHGPHSTPWSPARHPPASSTKETSHRASQYGPEAAGDSTRRNQAPEQSGGGSEEPLSSCSLWSSARWRSWSPPSCRPWSCGSLPAEWGRWPWWGGSCKLAHHSPPSHSWRAKRHSGPSGNGWGCKTCGRYVHWGRVVEYRDMTANLPNTNLMMTQSRKSVSRPFWVI